MSGDDAEQAFAQVLRQREPDKTPPPYRTITGLPGVPNVCLRLPTGGGQNLAGRAYRRRGGPSLSRTRFPVVLWLVPTNTIRVQTAEALKKPAHPYRAALDEAFDGAFRCSIFPRSPKSGRKT
jgi:hypothetical protein